MSVPGNLGESVHGLRDAHLAADWVNGREAGRNGYWSETVVPFPFVPWPFVPLVSVDDLALSFSS